jgi:murein DD-endopeptidase MepM/ murein hydrolase activator NlpD
LTAWENGTALKGQGGPGPTLEPTTVQENSIFAHNPADIDYAEEIADERVGIAEYTVQPGDSLSFIARDYGVNIESIMWANGLRDSNSIREGNVLKIPPVSGVIHTVKSGDTISTIAKKYGVEADTIITYNRLSQDGKLQINDELIVPDGKIKTAGIVARSTPSFAHLPNLDNYFAHPTNGLGRISQWLHGRNGIDIADSYGTPIYAAADGTVVGADGSGWNGGYGLFVKISHSNGTDTLYAHMSKVLVAPGQTVQKGQKIGQIGSTGRSTGSHLHFEVHGAKNPLAR